MGYDIPGLFCLSSGSASSFKLCSLTVVDIFTGRHEADLSQVTFQHLLSMDRSIDTKQVDGEPSTYRTTNI